MTRISLMMAATLIAFEMSATAAEKTGTLDLDIQREEAQKPSKSKVFQILAKLKSSRRRFLPNP